MVEPNGERPLLPPAGDSDAPAAPTGSGPEPAGTRAEANREEEIRLPDGRILHPAIQHEASDARFGRIVLILAGAVIVGAIIQGTVWVFFNRYNAYESSLKRSAYPLAPTPSMALPRGPRLEQINRLGPPEQPPRGTPRTLQAPAAAEANVYLREQAQEAPLDRYGPTGEKGYVHIPIERAMEYLVDKLPVRAKPSAGGPRDRGLVDGGESNAGRLLRKEPRWTDR